VFITHGREELGATADGIDKFPQRISDGVNFEISYRMMMRTGIVIYAEYGVDIDVINELSPYREQSIRRVITSTRNLTHPDINKKCTYQEFLELCEGLGRFTRPEVSKLVQIDSSSVHHKIKKLVERDRVEKVGEHRAENGNVIPMFQLTEPASAEFECESEECGFTCDSIKGIDVHERRMH
jgi:predicted transcriptional regulator